LVGWSQIILVKSFLEEGTVCAKAHKFKTAWLYLGTETSHFSSDKATLLSVGFSSALYDLVVLALHPYLLFIAYGLSHLSPPHSPTLSGWKMWSFSTQIQSCCLKLMSLCTYSSFFQEWFYQDDLWSSNQLLYILEHLVEVLPPLWSLPQVFQVE